MVEAKTFFFEGCLYDLQSAFIKSFSAYAIKFLVMCNKIGQEYGRGDSGDRDRYDDKHQ